MSTDLGPDLDQDPPGHALSTRGYVLFAAIPPLIAIIGITLLHFHYNPNQVLDGKLVPTLNSSYHASSTPPGAQTVLQGRLELGGDGCVQLAPDNGTPLTPVFPAGYVVTKTAEDQLNLYDSGRHIIGHDGDELRAKGQLAPAGSDYATGPCAPKSGQLAIIESPIVVTGQ